MYVYDILLLYICLYIYIYIYTYIVNSIKKNKKEYMKEIRMNKERIRIEQIRIFNKTRDTNEQIRN